jgi:hypothetical protein
MTLKCKLLISTKCVCTPLASHKVHNCSYNFHLPSKQQHTFMPSFIYYTHNFIDLRELWAILILVSTMKKKIVKIGQYSKFTPQKKKE